MSIPRFCKNCNNILGYPNIVTELIICKLCYDTTRLPNNDKLISVQYYDNLGTSIKEIFDDDVLRLINEPTTKKIERECKSCKNKYMYMIYDESYNFIFACGKCESIYR